MKADEPRQNRIPFMMSDAELAAVDEWRFTNRIATRAEAIRRLCQVGLAYDHETGASRVHARTAIRLALVGLRRILDVGSQVQDERARDILEAMDDVQQSVRAMIALFQDMATTDTTATAMEEAGDFAAQLRKAVEAKAAVDARRTK